jgi:hypothetical protein
MPNPRRCLAAALAAGAAMLAAPAAAAPSAADDTPPPPAPAPAAEYRPLTIDSNVLDPSLVTAADIDRFLAPTPLAGYGGVFMTAEATTGVNARFLVGITWVENNSGSSVLAQTQHNLFSILGAGGWASYDSFESSILQSADYIGRTYAHPGGAYYRGGSIAAIGRVYAADPAWASKVANAANYITPGDAPSFAAAVRITSVSSGTLAIRVVNLGRAAWDRIAGARLLVHYRWSKPGMESSTGLLTATAPGLRNSAGGDVALDGFQVPPGTNWRLTVNAEMDGDGWVAALGPAASDRIRFPIDERPETAATRGAR